MAGLLAKGNKKKDLMQGQPFCSTKDKSSMATKGNSRGSVNPGGGASHRNPESNMYSQFSQDKVFHMSNISDNDSTGAKARGHKKQVAPVSVKGVNGSHECEKIQTPSVLGVKSTLIDQGDYVPVFDVKVSCGDEKFLNSTLMNTKKSVLSKKSVFFQAWKNQTDFDFGFLPLSNFIMPHVLAEKSYEGLTPLQMHAMVKASGQPNYMHCRIPVPSQLNIAAWKQALDGYWDTQLIQLLEFGFPLDFNRNSYLGSESSNHKSAVEFPQHVQAYLQEEIKFGAILGPFSDHPIDDAHFSPFMTREKSNSDKRRVIIDLSWPKGASVNDGIHKDSYLATDFCLTFPTVDHITQELKKFGRGCHIYKVDVSRAFRHVKLDPRDYDLLGLRWRDVTYVDTCVPFGSRHGTQIFQRLSDAVRHVMRQKGFKVINYVDDFVGVATPDVARRSYDALRQLMRQLGLDVSAKKLVSPATSAVCLGVNIDTVDATISIPQEKLGHITAMVHEWSKKQFCTKRHLQSLLGNLLYIHKCVRPSRIFVNRMLELLRQNYDATRITLTPEFKRDIRWFMQFLARYNGTSYFDHKPPDHTTELDACLVGLGGRFKNFVYHLPVVRHYRNLSIVHLEMINILVAIKVFGHMWHRQLILVKCDNDAVVQVLTSGKTRDPFLATCARNIWQEAAVRDIELKYVHIMGKQNKIADLLSRWENTAAQYHLLNTLVQSPVWVEVGPHLLDLNYEI